MPRPRASVPERGAMRLTGHTSRTIVDRDHIIHEQELLDAGDQLVAYLAQHAQATPRGRAHPAGAAATRTTPPRATHHRVRAHDDRRLLEQKMLRDHRAHATGATPRRGHDG